MEEVKKQGVESLFVPYDLALELKKLGFGEPCFGFYDTDGYWYLQYCRNGNIFKINNGALSPTFSQAFRFFRETYKLHLTITSISQESWHWHITKPGESLGKLYEEDFYTYEDAETDGLKKLIELVKN